MKKISIFLTLMLLITGMKAFAIYDTSLCPKEPYDISNTLSQVVSNITGTNFLFTKVAEAEIQKEMKEFLGGSPNVEITPYSAGDFSKGKFKGMTIEIPQANKNGIAFSNFKAKTMCDFNHVIINDKNISFAENFLMDFSLDFTNDDLKNIVNTQKYIDMVNSLHLNIGSFSLFRILNPEVKIENNKLALSFETETSALVLKQQNKVNITSELKAVDGKIQLANLGVNGTKLDMGVLLPLINKINPLNFQTELSKNSTIAQIKNIDIIDNMIKLEGVAYIPKNYVLNK